MTSERYAMNFPVFFGSPNMTNYNIYIIKATHINTVHNIPPETEQICHAQNIAVQICSGNGFFQMEKA